jgi:hypothetical protein
MKLVLVQSFSYLVYSILDAKRVLWWNSQSTFRFTKKRKRSMLFLAVLSAYVSFQCIYFHPTITSEKNRRSWFALLSFNFGFIGLAVTVWMYKARNWGGETSVGGKLCETWYMLMLHASLSCIALSFQGPDDAIVAVVGSTISIAIVILTKMVRC